MTAIGLVRSRGLCGRGWSIVALLLCFAAVAASFAVVTSDQGAFDWRWWLLALPIGACVAAVLLPVRNALVGALIVISSFVVLSGFSIGLFFVPAFVALVFATGRTQ